jgi:hypothetical protein
MFGVSGLLLFMGTGLVIPFAFGLLPRGRRVAAAVALFVAALALYSASALGWGGADAPDGTRYKASPVGLSHVLTPHQAVSQTVDCGWHARSGYTVACRVAVGGESAFRQLRAVYPLVMVATACCLLGAVVCVLPVPRLQRYQTAFPACASLCAVVAVALFARSLATALEDLRGLSVGTGGTLGTMQLTAAVLLCLSTALSTSRTRPAIAA